MLDVTGDVFTAHVADEFRRAIGELVRVVRLTEDTSESQIETLGWLARNGSQSIASLARHRRIRHQSMSSTIADLEGLGLVARTADPDDARGVLIELTETGADMIRESRIRRSGLLKRTAEAALTADELETLARTPALLAKLSAAIPRD